MKLDYKRIVDNCTHDKACDQQDLELFIQVFEAAILETAQTSAKMARFELGDFSFIDDENIKCYTLMLSREKEKTVERWDGKFTNGIKILSLSAVTEMLISPEIPLPVRQI